MIFWVGEGLRWWIDKENEREGECVESGQLKHAEQQKGGWITRQELEMRNFMCM